MCRLARSFKSYFHKPYVGVLAASFLAVGVSTPTMGFCLPKDGGEIVIVDCAGVPRLSQQSMVGDSVALQVKASKGENLILEKQGVKLNPSSNGDGILFSPLEPGTWKLCSATGQVGAIGELSLITQPSGSIASTSTLSTIAIGGAAIGAAVWAGSNNNGGSDELSTGLPTDTESAGKPPVPAAGGSSGGRPLDPSKYPIGEPGEPLSPYR